MRDSFIFYKSFFEAMQGLSDEQKGQCFDALASYALTGEEPSLENPIIRLFFTMAKPQIDVNNQRFENGKRGGRPRKQDITEEYPEIEPNKNQTITKIKPKNNQTETNPEPNVNVNNKKNKISSGKPLDILQKKFKKPTVDEIKGYCLERNNTVIAEKFYDFYESKGWKVGNQPMKDWKAAVRTWERSSVAPSGSKTQETTWEHNMRLMREMELENQMKLQNGQVTF